MFTRRLLNIKVHTRRVLIFKRSLPAFAFLIAALMLAWPTLFAPKEQFQLAVKIDNAQTTANVDMEQVRFYSQDRKQQPLTVVAPKIRETDHVNNIVTLSEPIATYKMQSGVTLTSTTPYGLAFQNEEYLFFEEDVIATSDNGYRAETTRVVCDYKSGRLENENPVKITGPTGELHAEGFTIYNKGNNIDFKGKSNILILSEEGNIRVRSENGVLINQTSQTITADKNVNITQNGSKITADKAVMVYNTASQNIDNRIARIDIIGNVIVTSATHKITGNAGVYEPRSSKIQITGNVVLYQGNNRLEGESALLNLTSGESMLVPKQRQDGTSERIRGQFIPAELK